MSLRKGRSKKLMVHEIGEEGVENSKRCNDVICGCPFHVNEIGKSASKYKIGAKGTQKDLNTYHEQIFATSKKNVEFDQLLS